MLKEFRDREEKLESELELKQAEIERLQQI
jgi:hypothetical protein